MTAEEHDDKHLTKRTKRTEELRRRILDESMKLFFEQGFEGTTTRQILDRVGILNGSLYNIYRSKEEIFSDIVMEVLTDAQRQTPDYVDEDIPACLQLGFLLNVQLYFAARSERIAELLTIAYSRWDIHQRVVVALTEWLSKIDTEKDLDTEAKDFVLKLEACIALAGTYIERIYHEPDTIDPLDAMPIVINTRAGLKNVEPLYLDVGRLFDANRRQMLIEVAIPSAIPAIIAGIKTATSTGWMVVLAAEMLSAKSGVGFLVTRGMDGNDMPLVLVAMITIGIVGALLGVVTSIIERLLCPWLQRK